MVKACMKEYKNLALRYFEQLRICNMFKAQKIKTLIQLHTFYKLKSKLNSSYLIFKALSRQVWFAALPANMF